MKLLAPVRSKEIRKSKAARRRNTRSRKFARCKEAAASKRLDLTSSNRKTQKMSTTIWLDERCYC